MENVHTEINNIILMPFLVFGVFLKKLLYLRSEFSDCSNSMQCYSISEIKRVIFLNCATVVISRTPYRFQSDSSAS